MEVGIKGARFFANHGFYPEENKMGCVFVVDLSVTFESSLFEEENLQSTINYQALYNIVDSEMKTSYKLLETLLLQIEHNVKSQFPFILNFKLRIEKHTPQLGGPLDYTFVEETFNY